MLRAVRSVSLRRWRRLVTSFADGNTTIVPTARSRSGNWDGATPDRRRSVCPAQAHIASAAVFVIGSVVTANRQSKSGTTGGFSFIHALSLPASCLLPVSQPPRWRHPFPVQPVSAAASNIVVVDAGFCLTSTRWRIPGLASLAWVWRRGRRSQPTTQAAGPQRQRLNQYCELGRATGVVSGAAQRRRHPWRADAGLSQGS